jgi:hypothetical protein
VTLISGYYYHYSNVFIHLHFHPTPIRRTSGRSWKSSNKVMLFLPPNPPVSLSLKAVPWLRRLVAGLWPWRHRFHPRLVHVRFLVDKMALRQGFLGVLQSPSVTIILQCLSPYLCSCTYLSYHKDERAKPGDLLTSNSLFKCLMLEAKSCNLQQCIKPTDYHLAIYAALRGKRRIS